MELAGAQAEHSRGGAGGKLFVVGSLIRERDDGAFERSPVCERKHSGGRAFWDRPISAARLDQAGTVLEQKLRYPLELAPNRMLVLVAELDPQRHHHSGDVAPAEDSVAARQREQLCDRIQCFAGRLPLPYETSVPGVFAVGDVRHGSMKRVAAAVGEGSSAVRSVHDYLATLG